MVTDSTGHSCFDTDYYPYGQEMDHTATCPPTNRFTGYEYDSETSNYYAFFRYYSPRLGRFMTPDPLGGDVGSPQSLNRYSYVVNNPLKYADPLGLHDNLCVPDCSSGGGWGDICPGDQCDTGGEGGGLCDILGCGGFSWSFGFGPGGASGPGGGEPCDPGINPSCGDCNGDPTGCGPGSPGPEWPDVFGVFIVEVWPQQPRGKSQGRPHPGAAGAPSAPQTPAQAATQYCQQHGQLSFNIPFTHIPVTISLSVTAFLSFSSTEDISVTLPPSAGASVDITIGAPEGPSVPVQFGAGKNASVGTFLTPAGARGLSASLGPSVGAPVTISPTVANACGLKAGGHQ